MAISITAEPTSGDLIAAYIPGANDFEVEVTVSTGELPPKIKTYATFYKIGTGPVVDTSIELPHEYSSLATLTYSFDVDMNGRVQAYFDSLGIFPTLDTYPSGVSDGLGIDYVLTATSVRATGTDDTYQDVTTATSSAITSVNANRDLTQPQNMTAYDANTSVSSFFTNKPNNTVVDYSTNEWLTVHDANNKYRVRVQYYDSTGLLATRYFYITGTTIGENNTGKIGLIPCGPVGIDAVGAAGRFLASATAFPMETNGVTHYDVRVEDSGPTNYTDTRTYYIQACNPSYRLHFVNLLGGIDSLLVSRYKNETTSATGTNYATAKHSGNTAQVSGTQVLQKVGSPGIAFKMAGLSEAEMLWLRNLVLSNAVRLEKDGAYISLIVTKADLQAEDELGQTYSLDFEAEYSNKIEGLRN
jgi:hypothetical protein